MGKADIGLILGSFSDKEKMEGCKKVLDEFGVSYDYTIASAHRTPEKVKNFVCSCEQHGCKIFICGAGMAAHLAGAVAGMTVKPVIGVPLSGKTQTGVNGVDALLSTVQMPSGIPVATVALDGAKNAAYLAIEILALGNEELCRKLEEARAKMALNVRDDDEKLYEAWK